MDSSNTELTRSHLEQLLGRIMVKAPEPPEMEGLRLETASSRRRSLRWAWSIVPAVMLGLLILTPGRRSLLWHLMRYPFSARSMLGVQTAWSFDEGYTLTFDIFEIPNVADGDHFENGKRFYKECDRWAQRHGMSFSPSPFRPAEVWSIPEPGRQYEAEFTRESNSIHLRSNDPALCNELAAVLSGLPGVSQPVITEPVTDKASPTKVIINGREYQLPGQFNEEELSDLYREIEAVRQVGRVVHEVNGKGPYGFLIGSDGIDKYHLGKVFRADLDKEGNLVIDTVFKDSDDVTIKPMGGINTPHGVSPQAAKLLEESSKTGYQRLPERNGKFRYEAQLRYWFVDPKQLHSLAGTELPAKEATLNAERAKSLQQTFDDWVKRNPQVRAEDGTGDRIWGGPEHAGTFVTGFTVRLETDDLPEFDSIEKELRRIEGLPDAEERIFDYDNLGFVKHRGYGEVIDRSPAPLK